jgi:uncharacterized protein DUF2628
MDLTQDQVRAFVGPNADYYFERWHRVQPEAGSRALGFNWPAFFLTISWLLYRRMYRWFWIAIAVWLGYAIIGGLALVVALHNGARGTALVLNVVLFGILPWFVPVIFGIYGSYWYYLHARRQISQLTPAGQADLAAVGRMGGTNLWAAVTSAVVIGFLAIWAKSQDRPRREHPTTRPHLSERRLAPRQSADLVIPRHPA